MKVAIILSPSTTPQNFSSKYIHNLADFADHQTTFLFTDQILFIAKYFHNRKYRDCIIYHLGSEPRHKIGNYNNIGGFSSYTEINELMKNDADIIISDED